MWKVGGIKIERTLAQNFFLRMEQNFFTLGPFTRKGKEILGWAKKSQIMYMHKGPTPFWRKVTVGQF